MTTQDTHQATTGGFLQETTETIDETIVFVENYVTKAEIGVFSHEKGKTQPLVFALEVGCRYGDLSACTQHENVVCYKLMIEKIENILRQGHIDVVETVADRVACDLMQDKRILWLRVSVKKPDAIKNAEAVGITLTRRRKGLRGI